MSRKLAGILVADAVGYSARMEENEATALAALSNSRAIMDGILAEHEGSIIATAADSVIAEFPSALDAVRAALDAQAQLERDEADNFRFRIGVHFGDVVRQDGTLLGDGVNIAARLEPLAPKGGIMISGGVADQIVGKVDARFASKASSTGPGRSGSTGCTSSTNPEPGPRSQVRSQTRRRSTGCWHEHVISASPSSPSPESINQKKDTPCP